jgi:hypothetical protein
MISKSTVTRIVFMIYGSAITHFLSTISESIVNYVHFHASVVKLNHIDDLWVDNDVIFVNDL